MTEATTFLSSHLSDVALLIVGALYGVGILKNHKDVDTINDDKKWESALRIRDTTIADLTAELDRQKSRHQSELATMQEQLAALQQRVEVLSNTVSGRDMLIDVVKDQKLIITGVEDIKTHLTTLTVKAA